MIFPYYQTPSPRSIPIKHTLFTWHCIQDPHRQIKSHTALPRLLPHLMPNSHITQDTNHRAKRKCKFVRTPLHIGVRRGLKTDESSAPHIPETYIFARCESLCFCAIAYVSPTPEYSIPWRVVPKKPYEPYTHRICKEFTLETQTTLTRALRLYHKELKPSHLKLDIWERPSGSRKICTTTWNVVL